MSAVDAWTVPERRPSPGRCYFARGAEPLLCATRPRCVRNLCKKRDGDAEIDLGVRPLGSGNLGAEINSLQASRATAEDVRELQQILARHGVVCLRNQELTPAQYVAFAKLFGEIEPSTRERYWLPEQNEIYVISNVVENGRPIGNPNDDFFGTPISIISSAPPPTRSSTASRRRRSAPTPSSAQHARAL